MANQQTLEELYAIIKGRKETPKEGSYTNYLFDKGLDKILKRWAKKQQKLSSPLRMKIPEN